MRRSRDQMRRKVKGTENLEMISSRKKQGTQLDGRKRDGYIRK